MDLNYIKNVAVGAAYESAAILNRFFGNLSDISNKGPDDLVTEADVASEKQIIHTIRSKFPDHDILAEESGQHQSGQSSCRWIIDPLDGTTNYAYQIPIFSISIGFAVDDDIMVGVVLHPASGELFTAAVKKEYACSNDCTGHRTRYFQLDAVHERPPFFRPADVRPAFAGFFFAGVLFSLLRKTDRASVSASGDNSSLSSCPGCCCSKASVSGNRCRLIW